jgi:hypothetical protein
MYRFFLYSSILFEKLPKVIFFFLVRVLSRAIEVVRNNYTR